MRKFLWSIFELAETVAIALIIVFVIRNFLVQPFLVGGSSMEPGFSQGDYLLIDELAYRFREPVRGEVVVFKAPEGGDYFIKRIVGLPKEEIEVKEGKVFIAGREIEEKYLSSNLKTLGSLNVVLKEGEYFVMGDNRNYSFDSRNWGAMARDKIIGLVRLRLWPLNRVQAFEKPVY